MNSESVSNQHLSSQSTGKVPVLTTKSDIIENNTVLDSLLQNNTLFTAIHLHILHQYESAKDHF